VQRSDQAEDGVRAASSVGAGVRMTRRAMLSGAGAAGLSIGLGAYLGECTAARAMTPRRGGTLRVGWIPNAHTLDPHYSVDWAERHVMYGVYNTLVAATHTFDIAPELARSWEVSSDGLAVTLHLQPDVRFHDGTACDAAAVKWNLDFILDAQNNSPQRKALEPFVAGVEASGATTVTLRMKRPYAGLLAVLTERPGFIVSPAAWRKYGKDLGRHPVGTGMYRFIEWLPDDHVTISRFDGYWERGKPYLDAIYYKTIVDPAVRDAMVRTGEIDITSQPNPRDIPALSTAPGVKVVAENPGSRWWATQWRVDRPPFDNKALRQAIACGIDRDEFVKVVLGGHGVPAKGPTSPAVWWYDPKVKGYSYDPDKARRLLAEAGYGNGFQAEFAVDNTPLALQFAQLLQAQLAKIKVGITINPVDPADLYDQQLAGKVNWSRTDWSVRSDPGALDRILFYTRNYANSTGYSNPTVDKRLDQGDATYDRAARKRIYAQIDQTVIDDAPYIWFFYVPSDAPMRADVENYVWIPDDVPRYRDLWLAK
jgi:peptide/nickel transport system substrate-binding protein